MAVVTKTEFAKMCGVDTVYINQYVLRKKLVQIEKKVAGKKRTKKLFDTENPYNRDFFNKRMEEMKGGKKELKPLQNIPQKATPKKKPDNEGVNDSGYDLDQKKKQRDIELKELSIEEKQIKIEKLKGSSMPNQFVGKLINLLSDSFINTFNDSIDEFQMKFSHEAKLNPELTAKLKLELINMLNETHEKSLDQCKNEYEQIIKSLKKEIKPEDEQEL